MLNVVQKVFFGPIKNAKNRELSDLNMREAIALSPLVLLVFLIGLFPSVLLDRSAQAVNALELRTRLVWMQAQPRELGPPTLLTDDLLLERVSDTLRDSLSSMLADLDKGAPPPPFATPQEKAP